MIKSIFATLITVILALQAYGQKQCDISDHFEDFISIQRFSYNGKDHLRNQVLNTDKESCFSGLVNNNTKFIDYLLKHFSSYSRYQDHLKITDSVALRKAYFSDLKEDSMFVSVMNELVHKTIVNKDSKDTVSMDNLLNIAVKYFSIIKVTDGGQYVGKVCAGLNDIKKTEAERKPFIEAFAFSSILKHYQSDEFNLYNEFVKAIKELYKVNLGIDNDEKLLRAQGAMFLLMRNNETLKQMLKTEYESGKDHLPFILTEG